MINVKITAPTATIIIDRKDKHNALDDVTIKHLSQVFGDLHQEKRVRSVVLAGSGKTFCSGVDVRAWQEALRDDGESLETWDEVAAELQSLLEQMLRFPKVIIAALEGPAIGFGVALVLASDLVVASSNASFALPAPRLGLVSGHVAPLLYFRYGGAAAARLLLGDEQIDAQTASALGWVHRLVKPDTAWMEADAWGRAIAGNATEAVQMTKRLLNEMIGEAMFDALSSGASSLATMCTTEVAAEGINAFLEKRPPNFD